MSSKHLLQFSLDGGSAQEVSLRPGQGVYLHAVERGGKVVLEVCGPLQGNPEVRHQREMAAKERELNQAKRNLAMNAEREAHEERGRSAFEGFMLQACRTPYFQRLISQQTADPLRDRTPLEAKCFNNLCDVSAIKRDLKKYIEQHRQTWQQNYWLAVWQVLTDLKWWGKGTFVQFVTWVTEMGYPFTMDNLKKIRREVGAELSRWRSLPPSSNQHVAVAWELYNLFMNPSVPGNVMTYETGYIDHTTLTDELLGRTPTRKTGDKSLRIHIDSTIHAKVPHYAKHKHHRESFAMASAVSRLMVSIGCEADTRPGLSLAAHTIATTHVIAATTRTATIPTMRTRSAHSLPRGYRLR